MKTCADYIADAKAALGDARMSDRELGERLGDSEPYSQSQIAGSKSGVMSDTVAVAIAKAIGVDPGEVLLVARLEREKNADTRQYVTAFLGRLLETAPTIRFAPEVVMRGGRKVVPRLASQGWRKRSEAPTSTVV